MYFKILNTLVLLVFWKCTQTNTKVEVQEYFDQFLECNGWNVDIVRLKVKIKQKALTNILGSLPKRIFDPVDIAKEVDKPWVSLLLSCNT